MPEIVIVVDNDEEVAGLIANVLEQQGMKVDKVFSGNKALNLLKGKKYDVALINMVMPGMDGIDVLSEIRRMPNTADMPVIMIGVRHQRELLLNAWFRGIDGYITKPFSSRELVAVVEETLKKTAEERREERKRQVKKLQHE